MKYYVLLVHIYELFYIVLFFVSASKLETKLLSGQVEGPSGGAVSKTDNLAVAGKYLIHVFIVRVS